MPMRHIPLFLPAPKGDGWTPLIMVTKAAENGVARPRRPRPYRIRTTANAEGLREHTVSSNRVKCSTNVRRIAFEKA